MSKCLFMPKQALPLCVAVAGRFMLQICFLHALKCLVPKYMSCQSHFMFCIAPAKGTMIMRVMMMIMLLLLLLKMKVKMKWVRGS